MNNKGFTLIELLMVMLLGSFVLVGIIQVFSLNQNTSALQKEMLEVQNTGFFAMKLLTNDFQKSGSSEDYLSKSKVGTFDFDKTSVDSKGNTKITIFYDRFNNEFDCSGKTTGNTIYNTYKVDNNILLCNNIELVKNVERFSVLFGIDYNNDNSIDRYVDRNTAAIIQNDNTKKIIAVYFSLLLKSDKALESKSLKKFNILNKETIEYNDGYFYRVFSKKVVLKNML